MTMFDIVGHAPGRQVVQAYLSETRHGPARCPARTEGDRHGLIQYP